MSHVVAHVEPLRLQSRLGGVVTQRSADPLSGALLRPGRQQLAALLAHVVLLLHGGELLVLGEGEREGDAEEEGRGGDDPGALAAEGQDAPRLAGDVADVAGHPASRGRGDDVAQGV